MGAARRGSRPGRAARIRLGPVPGRDARVTVADLDAAKVKLTARGVEVGHEGGGEGLGPRFVEFNDPDGNVLALFEYEDHA